MADDFGARLVRLRKARGLSQRDLAARTGIKAQNLSQIERGGRAQVRYNTLVRLIDALDCSADVLFGLEDDTPPVLAEGTAKQRKMVHA